MEASEVRLNPKLKTVSPYSFLLSPLSSLVRQELYLRLRVVVTIVTFPGMSYLNDRGLRAGIVFLAWFAAAPVSLLPISLLAAAPLQAQSPQSLDVVTIGPRFSPNPLEVKGSAGGNTLAKDLVGRAKTPTGECVGYASAKPNSTIELTEFFDSLSLVVQSADDTALAIQGPGGLWCNDDFQGKNPGVSGQWLPGTYKIWVSSYAPNRAPAYVLRITEKRQ